MVEETKRNWGKYLKKANKSLNFGYAISCKQRDKGLPDRTLKQEVKTRITSTHTMMCSFLYDPNEFLEENIDVSAVERNIEAVNEAMVVAKLP